VSHAVSANQQQNKVCTLEKIIGIDLAKRISQVQIVSLQGRKKVNKMLTPEKLMLYILATDFRLNSSSRYFSATSCLNFNENFAMSLQFSI